MVVIWGFLKYGIEKPPWVSLLKWSSMTWMIWDTQRGSLDLHHPRPARCSVEFFLGQTLGVNGKW